ncbi:hypothetical protein FPV16_05635 [Methylobacterium sp. W2]|uniref:hypothetical protein n=1 Tax=Methylobacterium sp. W2 TaxID=2598107 RepID=UPI001D0C9B40|nr:hypothetical protein [Methylobacterium sp. W2]MCC0805710.1 hypothetical protein [Methylobacterium sp. W2]
MPNALTVWTEPTGAIVPRSAIAPNAIVAVAKGLTTRDQRQVVAAFEAESYEMVAGFVLNKALSQLKKQLSSLGMEFVGEMLGRQDLDADSIPTVSISNFEAVRLAQELGILNSTDAKRLSQHTELLAHFDNLDANSAEYEEMSREEAVGFLRTCVNSVLGHGDNFAPTEFVTFRSALENRTFKSTDSDIAALHAAPYFFKRTTLSILLSAMKSRSGAQFEHTLGNIVVIVPVLWPQLRDAEKWSVGQAYAEAVNAGASAAILALKRALMAVQGFDYVPETLRSQTFSAAASAIINVHSAGNNFYNEPSAVSALVKLGSTIPWPAFPICMSSVFAVYLGNMYGHTWGAQRDVESLLKRLTNNQWEYYLNECLPNDQLILQKLTWYDKPRDRWIELCDSFPLTQLALKSKDSLDIVEAAAAKKVTRLKNVAERMLKKSELRS